MSSELTRYALHKEDSAQVAVECAVSGFSPWLEFVLKCLLLIL